MIASIMISNTRAATIYKNVFRILILVIIIFYNYNFKLPPMGNKYNSFFAFENFVNASLWLILI